MRLKRGKRLDAYHDGKLAPSRLEIVEVIDVVKIERLSKRYLRMWKKAINEDFDEALLGGVICYVDGPQRFWDWNCGEFIFAKFVSSESANEEIMFAKRPGGEWYGVNWNYLLDVHGKIRNEGIDRWTTCAKEMGQRMEWNDKEQKYDYYDIKTGRKVVS